MKCSTIMHQSIPSTNIPPGGKLPGNVFEVVKNPASGQKFSAKARPLAQSSTYPRGNFRSSQPCQLITSKFLSFTEIKPYFVIGCLLARAPDFYVQFCDRSTVCRPSDRCWFRLWYYTCSKLIEFDDVIIWKTKKTWNCLYLGSELKSKTEIWYLEVIYDADFDYATEIRSDHQNRSNLMTPSFWDNENIKLPISC